MCIDVRHDFPRDCSIDVSSGSFPYDIVYGHMRDPLVARSAALWPQRFCKRLYRVQRSSDSTYNSSNDSTIVSLLLYTAVAFTKTESNIYDIGRLSVKTIDCISLQ